MKNYSTFKKKTKHQCEMFTFSNQPQFLDCVDNREMSVKMKVSGLLCLFAKFKKTQWNR